MTRKKILIVDDNAVILRTLSVKLTTSGYDVVTATDGGEAVSAVRKQQPDCILLDITFPPDVGHGGGIPWDGFLIMDWIRRLNEAKGIPFIVITGGDPALYEKRALAAGATHFFHKPIENDELVNVIRKLLEERSTAAQSV